MRALAASGVLATAGCGHAPVAAAPPHHADTPDGRLTDCLVAAGYPPAPGFLIVKAVAHARLLASADVRDGRAVRRVEIYRADADGQVAPLGAAMTASGLRVSAVAGRRLVGVSRHWSHGPRPRVLERCTHAATRGRPAPAVTAWP